MRITKIGHCCLLIEAHGKRLLTDPGNFSTEQDHLENIDAVLITHEHPDHLHMESLKNILALNPKAAVVSNSVVGKLLDAEHIPYIKVEHGDAQEIVGIEVEGFGTNHAVIYSSFPPMYNTGYFIDNTLFYPGDALTNPQKPVKILALPIAGPWIKLSEVIEYVKELHPSMCFPVHDAVVAQSALGYYYGTIGRLTEANGIIFTPLHTAENIEY
jgi:L-ascorbate metabolism protein UlaG (beta-lactamase superfamily)